MKIPKQKSPQPYTAKQQLADQYRWDGGEMWVKKHSGKDWSGGKAITGKDMNDYFIESEPKKKKPQPKQALAKGGLVKKAKRK